MTVRIRTTMFLLVVCLAATGALVAQTPAALTQSPLEQTIPLDPAVTVGRFDNGLRYYIRTNDEPEDRAELRLVVNVGSIVEDDDQLGLAHFVEHMAFNGTRNFPKQALVEFMESIGMRFGPSVNAYTSFDETVYMLRVPTDDREALETGFLILEDWAQHVSFEPEEIDKERGVIIEEWRLGRGAGARMLDEQFPVLLQGSRYAERLPIGKTEILESFPHERLTDFYADWYRPDLMAVVAVGDFDAAAIEALIGAHFGDLPAAASPKPRSIYEVPDHLGTSFAIAADPETTIASVSVYSKYDFRDPTTFGAYRRQLVERLFAGMMASRFSELTQKPDAPFMGATMGRGLFVRTEEASIMSALVKENEIERGLGALFVEAERVARFGFAETELDRQKTNMLRSYERSVAERENQQSAALAGEFVRNFLHQEPIPGIELEYELVGRFLPDISLDEVNDLARGWAPDGSRVVLVSAPEKDGLEIPDEASLAAVIAAVEDLEIEPYVDEAANAPLLDVMPSPGAIVEATPSDEFGITEWTLSNGVSVVLVPTTFKDDEIVFRAFSPGGTSLASDENFIPARTATQVMTASGVGAFSMIDLRKKLTGKVASARPTIGPLDEGLSGGASKQDLETMFQLIYLTFTQPRADAEMFDVIISQTKALLANQTATPAFAFNKTLNDTMSQNHPRARITTPETMDEMDLDGSLAFYRERFADASDFTFIFAGSFELAEIQPFVVRYLATLPSIGRSETWRDEGIHPPTGVVEEVVEKGLEPQSQTAIVFTGPFDYTREGRVAIRAMASILQTRLRETLREDLGGTYSVSASPSYVRIPREEYRLNIRFGSNPDRADALSATVFEEIAKLKSDGPTEQEVHDAIEAIVRDYETNMESNSYLVSQLYFKYRDEAAVAELFDAVEFYRGLGIAPVHDAARRYLNTDNYVKVVLMPEPGGVR